MNRNDYGESHFNPITYQCLCVHPEINIEKWVPCLNDVSVIADVSYNIVTFHPQTNILLYPLGKFECKDCSIWKTFDTSKFAYAVQDRATNEPLFSGLICDDCCYKYGDSLNMSVKIYPLSLVLEDQEHPKLKEDLVKTGISTLPYDEVNKIYEDIAKTMYPQYVFKHNMTPDEIRCQYLSKKYFVVWKQKASQRIKLMWQDTIIKYIYKYYVK